MSGGARATITSVVAHIDHGKTSLIDSLVASQGRISRTLAGDIRFLDTRQDEQARGITLKLSAISLEHDGAQHVFIDTPGHVDFESLIQASAIFSDNFLVLIDVNEGITPRTYSLVKYTKGKRCVLAINKIDRAESPEVLLQKTLSVVSVMNGLVGEDVFGWEQNNVILCCATLCYGVNRGMFSRVVGKRGGLKNAVDMLFHIYKKIEEGDVSRMCERFKVRGRSKKSILSTMLPLSDCVFESVGSEAPGDCVGAFLQSDLVSLSPLQADREPLVMGVTAYGVLKTPGRYVRDSVLFVTRMFRGTIRVGDAVWCADGKSVAECTVESLYVFGINELVEKREVSGSNLVCIGGRLLKNSLVTDVPAYRMDVVSKITPFYKFKLVLDDVGRVDELKEVFRVMSCTEQFLRVRLNKYREMEVSCTGRVQCEKITADLEGLGFGFSVATLEEQFCEYASEPSYKAFCLGSLSLRVWISRADEGGGRQECLRRWEDGNRNQFVVMSELCSEMVCSVLEIFVSSGPLIRERIYETRFAVELQGDSGDVSSDELYSFVKSSLTSVYLSCSPAVAPSFYQCTISVQEEFIGETYRSLSRYSYVVVNESYEEKTGFHVLAVLIPQFMYPGFLEDIRIRTKGTAYLLVADAGYRLVLDFSKCIEGIRKRKGLFVEEKIVEEPSRQRTYKK